MGMKPYTPSALVDRLARSVDAPYTPLSAPRDTLRVCLYPRSRTSEMEARMDPETKAERIALDIINGNRNDAREALKRAKGKTIILDVLDLLIVLEDDIDIAAYNKPSDDLRRLLEG